MNSNVASQPRPGRGLSLADNAERLWWDMPWWMRSPAFLGLLWLVMAATCLTAFCVVVSGIVQRSQERQWGVAEQARQEWLCASARNRSDADCVPLQASVKD